MQFVLICAKSTLMKHMPRRKCEFRISPPSPHRVAFFVGGEGGDRRSFPPKSARILEISSESLRPHLIGWIFSLAERDSNREPRSGERGRKIDRRRWRKKGDFSSGSNLDFDNRAPLGRGKSKSLVATVQAKPPAALCENLSTHLWISSLRRKPHQKSRGTPLLFIFYIFINCTMFAGTRSYCGSSSPKSISKTVKFRISSGDFSGRLSK